VRSLGIALELAHTERFENYVSGFAAYDVWMRQLRADTMFARVPQEAVRSLIQPNAWCYRSLIDARASAARYLAAIAPEFSAEVAERLSRAATLYSEVAAALRAGLAHAPFPGDLADRPWSRDMRHAEAETLGAALALERQAVEELESARAAFG
jgi:hypothetical protein